MDNPISLNGIFKNQNTTLLSLATTKGYRIYETFNFLQVSDEDDFQELIGPLKIVQLLYESNVILFVGAFDNLNFTEKQIIIWDDIKKRKIGVIMLNESVIDIKVSKTAIFAVLSKKIIVFDIMHLGYLFTINSVNSDLRLISITNLDDLSILAYTNSFKSEEITILKLISSNGKIKEKYQKSFYSTLQSKEKMVLSKKGDLLTIVSKGGSKIHIYSVNQYHLIYCLWRGNLDEEILDITFSKKNKFLSLVNSKDTLHIIGLNPSNHNIINCNCHEIDKIDKKQHKTFFKNVFSSVKNIFSSIKPINSFAKYKFNNQEVLSFNSIMEDKMNSVMILFEKVNELILINSKGIIEKIKFNSKEGGYCWNYKTINWLCPQKRDLTSQFD